MNIDSNENINFPLMVVARQPKEMISWQLPLSLESDSGYLVTRNTSRTLCHEIIGRTGIICCFRSVLCGFFL